MKVRRAMGHERCAVLAFSDELDAWLQARPMRKQLPISDTAGNGSLARFKIADSHLRFRIETKLSCSVRPRMLFAFAICGSNDAEILRLMVC